MSSDPKSRGIPDKKTAMQQCALGCAFAALVCVGFALCTGKQHDVPTQSGARLFEQGVAEVGEASFASTKLPRWFTKGEFLTTAAVESDPKQAETDILALLTHPRAGYEFSWPTYDDLPRADSESLKFRTRGPAQPRTDWGMTVEPPTTEWIDRSTEYLGMSPLVSPDDAYRWHWDWELSQLPERWTGPIDLLLELTNGSKGRFSTSCLADVLCCLYLNGFSSCRLDHRTVLAGHGLCVVELTTTGDFVDSCRFIEPREALAEVLATDARFVAQNGRTSHLSEIDQNTFIHRRPLPMSGPMGYYIHDWWQSISSVPLPVSAPSGSKPWASKSLYLVDGRLDSIVQNLCGSMTTSSTDDSKPTWLQDTRQASTTTTNLDLKRSDRRVGIAHH